MAPARRPLQSLQPIYRARSGTESSVDTCLSTSLYVDNSAHEQQPLGAEPAPSNVADDVGSHPAALRLNVEGIA
jgi:hypothetical protein